MRMTFGLLFAAAACAALAPANAAVNLTSGDVGDSFTIDFDGAAGTPAAAGVLTSITYTLTAVSADLKAYSFDYAVANTSATAARSVSYGFNVGGTGGAALASVTGLSGTFDVLALGKTLEGHAVDVCFKVGGNSNNCNGGANAGVLKDGTGSGSFTLNFSGAANEIAFDDFLMKYQSVAVLDDSSTRVPGALHVDPGTPAVPEPATWAMLVLGFGLVGAGMRRRRMLMAASA